MGLAPPPPDPLFAPFIRADAYGEAGHRVGLLRAARAALLAATLLPCRIAAALACVAGYYALLRALSVLPESVLKRRIAAFWGRFWATACLLALGFFRQRWVRVRGPSGGGGGSGGGGSSSGGGGGPPPGDRRRAWQVAIVSNHVGWADILVHMSWRLPSFVARDGTQDIPMIGLISRRIECIYVDRERKNGNGGANGDGAPPPQAGGVGEQVKRRILDSWEHPEAEHRPMLLFPEGTTSNGTCLLPFKTGAFLAGTPVQPVIIKYDKSPVSPAWESITAPRHLLLMLTQPFHGFTCYELPVYYPSDAERSDPKLYAANVRQFMLQHSGLQPSAATLEDKRRYQAELRERLAAAGGGAVKAKAS